MSSSDRIEVLEFGQSEKLTVRIRDLIHNYPEGGGVFKEFIQNADDAGATQIRFILDYRSHPSTRVAHPDEPEWTGPALLVWNDASFTEDDFTGIQQIGEGSKALAGWKTGRFGLGFNAAYNITDYPTLVSNDRLVFFDPHRHHPLAKNNKPGGAWRLSLSLWRDRPDLICPFRVAGLPQDTVQYPETIFRLPLRTDEHARRSDISTQAFTPQSFTNIVTDLAGAAAELLLFLKHLLHIEVCEIRQNDSSPRIIARFATTNCSEVTAARDTVNREVECGYEQLLARLKTGDQSWPRTSFRHQMHIEAFGEHRDETWHAVSGIYVDAKGEIVSAAVNMWDKLHQKALPWGGAAARLSCENDRVSPKKVNGRLFCFLPLPERTELPVHLNGYLDLNSARSAPFTDPEATGKDAVRRYWNEKLAEHVIARAYAELIGDIAAVTDPGSFSNAYGLWPDLSILPGLLRSVAESTYRSLANVPSVLSAAAPGRRSCIGEVWVLPEAGKYLHPACVAQQLDLPDPPLPRHVTEGSVAAGIALKQLLPPSLREMLRVERDTAVPIEQAPSPWLQRREWVVDLLRYCLTDRPTDDLVGVPLAILCDDQLHAFGMTGTCMFLADGDQISLFPQTPSWFLDPQFVLEVGLYPVKPASIVAMTPFAVVQRLWTVLDPGQTKADVPWQPFGASPPNATWLSSVYDYLITHHHDLQSHIRQQTDEIPFVPSNSCTLCCPGNVVTPLLLTAEQQRDAELLHALDACEVAYVDRPPDLLSQIRKLVATYTSEQIGVWSLTGPDLVDVLNDQPELATGARAYDPAVHDVLVDFLSDQIWQKAYKPEQLQELRKRQLFPTEAGELVSLEDRDVFLPKDFTPPALVSSIQLLKTKKTQWSTFLASLNPTKLDIVVYTTEVLLPRYAEMAASDQARAIRWLRENYIVAENRARDHGDDALRKLLRILRTTPLICCLDGSLHSADSIYDPRSEVVRQILGDSVPYPDLTHYQDGEEQWLEFFQQLGMSRLPQAQDLLAYIDVLVEEASGSSPSAVEPRVKAIFEHIRKHWESYSSRDVIDGSEDERISLGLALSRRAWLPASRDQKRCYAAMPPQNRLYRPEELYPPRLTRLVASQAPVFAYVEPEQDFGDALRFPRHAPLEVVLRHFDHVRETWQKSGAAGPISKIFEATLGTIYAYLGSPNQGEDPEEESDDAPVIEFSDNSEELRERYGDQPCLWDPKEQRFWRPDHVFRSDIWYLQPWRRRIAVQEPKYADEGYTALGRKEEPSVDDLLSVLRELHQQYGTRTLPPDVVQKVVELLRQLAHLWQDPQIPVTDVPVLTDSGSLHDSAEVLISDAPWFNGKFGPDELHLLHPQVNLEWAQKIGILSLSQSVKEELSESPRQSNRADAVSEAQRLTQLLRSLEFQTAMERLVRVTAGPVCDLSLSWLGEVVVTPASELRTRLTIALGLSELLADGDVAYHLDRDGYTIYLSVRYRKFWERELGQALNQRLGQHRVNDLSALLAILKLDPPELDDALTSMRVPPLRRVVAETIPEVATDSEDFVDLGESNSESGDSSDTVPESTEGGNIGSERPPVETGNAEEDTGKLDDLGPGDESSDDHQPPQEHPSQGDTHKASGQDTDDTDHQPDDADTGETESGGVDDDSRQPRSAETQPGTEHRGFTVGRRQHGNSRRWGEPHIGGAGENPPGKAGDRSRRRSTAPTGSHARRKGRVISYVIPDGAQPKERDPSNDEEPRNISIGEAAVGAVVDFERRNGRSPYVKPHNNPGYDICSRPRSGGAERYIEVKGIDGEWTEAGVPLSPTQLEYAKKMGEQFWLYVVEHACEPWRRKIHCIQDPIRRVNQFRFDCGWRAFSETYVEEEQEPPEETPTTDGHPKININKLKVGDSVHVPDSEDPVSVKEVRKGIDLFRITVQLSNGIIRKYRYDDNTGSMIREGK